MLRAACQSSGIGSGFGVVALSGLVSGYYNELFAKLTAAHCIPFESLRITLQHIASYRIAWQSMASHRIASQTLISNVIV